MSSRLGRRRRFWLVPGLQKSGEIHSVPPSSRRRAEPDQLVAKAIRPKARAQDLATRRKIVFPLVRPRWFEWGRNVQIDKDFSIV